MMAKRIIDTINHIYDTIPESCVLIMAYSGPIAAILSNYHNQDFEEMLGEKINNKDTIELQINSRLAYPTYKKRGVISWREAIFQN